MLSRRILSLVKGFVDLEGRITIEIKGLFNKVLFLVKIVWVRDSKFCSS